MQKLEWDMCGIHFYFTEWVKKKTEIPHLGLKWGRSCELTTPSCPFIALSSLLNYTDPHKSGPKIRLNWTTIQFPLFEVCSVSKIKMFVFCYKTEKKSIISYQMKMKSCIFLLTRYKVLLLLLFNNVRLNDEVQFVIPLIPFKQLFFTFLKLLYYFSAEDELWSLTVQGTKLFCCLTDSGHSCIACQMAAGWTDLWLQDNLWSQLDWAI